MFRHRCQPDGIRQAEPQGRNKPAVTLTAAMDKLEELLGEAGYATLRQIETMQVLEGISQRSLYNARKELALQTVSIGKNEKRETWWLRPDVDPEKFRLEHTPPPEQLEIPT